MQVKRVLISGAGIAGLALARRLRFLDIDYEILEKTASFEPCGTGIALPFNAMIALRKFELADKVLDVAHQVHEVVYGKPGGQILACASLDEAPLNQDKFVAMERHQLHSILGEGLIERVHFSTSITSLHPGNGSQINSKSILVNCTDPSLDGEYDLVVSAEGVHSSLRQQSCPDVQAIIDHGVTNWRFVVEETNHGLQPTYLFGRSDLFMMYPVSKDKLYCYGHIRDEKGILCNKEKSHDYLSQLFRHYNDRVRRLIRKAENIVTGRLRSVNQPCFFRGRIAFTGDAANACSPLLQQGAAAAFEDVLSLTEQLSCYAVDDALVAYRNQREKKVRWIINTSDAPFKNIKKMDTFLGACMRNHLIRKKGPFNVQGWRYLANHTFS